MNRSIAALFFGLLLIVLSPTPAHASVLIIAHRAGPNGFGEGLYPENSSTAFAQRAPSGVVLDGDIRVTSDAIPVLMHDPAVDRTTDCVGNVADISWSVVQTCHLDTLGSGSVTRASASPSETVPSLADVLATVSATGATFEFEAKTNLAADLERIYNVVMASGVPTERLIASSFVANTLTVFKQRLPGLRTILWTNTADGSGISHASSNGIWAVGPPWPISADYVRTAHAAGLVVLPWTLSTGADIDNAIMSGADAVVSDDPELVASRYGPRIAISASSVDAVAGNSVTLAADASSLTSTVNRIVWETTGDDKFDDGAGANLEVTFQSPGNWRIKAKAVDEDGQEAVSQIIIHVRPRPSTVPAASKGTAVPVVVVRGEPSVKLRNSTVGVGKSGFARLRLKCLGASACTSKLRLVFFAPNYLRGSRKYTINSTVTVRGQNDIVKVRCPALIRKALAHGAKIRGSLVIASSDGARSQARVRLTAAVISDT